MAIDYYVEFVTVPLATLLLLVASPPLDNAAISAWLVGYLAWVMVEYWMHRWLFHRVHRKQHMIHHHRPFDPAGMPGSGHAQAALAAVVGALLLLFQRYIGAALAGGFLLGYCTYIYTHHLIHIEWLGPNNRIRKRHDVHHRGIERNYNVLFPLGDLLFGTLA